VKKGDSEDTKLVVLPSQLVERLNELASKQGVSLSSFASEALEQALRAGEVGVSLEKTVDLYKILDVQRGSGALQVQRSSLNTLIRHIYSNKGTELKEAWYESGVWYGEYFRTKLGYDEALGFLEKALEVTWNLDEVKLLKDGINLNIPFSSFMMSKELTELLIQHVSGIMNSLGFQIVENHHIRGLATIVCRRKPKIKF